MQHDNDIFSKAAGSTSFPSSALSLSEESKPPLRAPILWEPGVTEEPDAREKKGQGTEGLRFHLQSHALTAFGDHRVPKCTQ